MFQDAKKTVCLMWNCSGPEHTSETDIFWYFHKNASSLSRLFKKQLQVQSYLVKTGIHVLPQRPLETRKFTLLEHQHFLLKRIRKHISIFKVQPHVLSITVLLSWAEPSKQWTSFHLQKALPIMNASSLQALILSTNSTLRSRKLSSDYL